MSKIKVWEIEKNFKSLSLFLIQKHPVTTLGTQKLVHWSELKYLSFKKHTLMSSICWKSDFFLERRHRSTFEIDFQIKWKSCYDFFQLQISSKMRSTCGHEADTRILCCTDWFKGWGGRRDICHPDGRTQHFLFLRWYLNETYQRVFSQAKTCQDHKQMSNNIQCFKQRNASFSVLQCYWFVFVMPVVFFHSFHAIAKPSLFLLCPEFSWWAQCHTEWNMVNLGLPSWQCPPTLGAEERPKTLVPRVGKETYWILSRAPQPPLPSNRPQARGGRGWPGTRPVQWPNLTKGMRHTEWRASARTAPVKKEKGGMFVVIVFVQARAIHAEGLLANKCLNISLPRGSNEWINSLFCLAYVCSFCFSY